MTRTRLIQALVFSILIVLAIFAALREKAIPQPHDGSEQPASTGTVTRAHFRTQDLRNPGFEDKLDGWEVHTYGAPAQVEVDQQVAHEGKQSLRLSATEPSDTALGQEMWGRVTLFSRFPAAPRGYGVASSHGHFARYAQCGRSASRHSESSTCSRQRRSTPDRR